MSKGQDTDLRQYDGSKNGVSWAGPVASDAAMSQATQMAAEEAELVILPTYDVRQLVDGGAQARLVLDGTPYILRITRAGKLILTK